jgi:ketose-bisphosphate aldolase
LDDCRRRAYALGYFESWNLESLQGVLDAAEQTRSPVIIGFNGEFLSRPDRRAAERLVLYGVLGKAAAESATVPCGLIFNECPADDWVLAATEVGFNLVMPADPTCAYDDYLKRVKRIVTHAHARQVAVEAELGELPCGLEPARHATGEYTDPETAAHFVKETGVDLLAVSAGNIHILVDGQRDLDLTQLEKLRAAISVPLVLHGGSGISDDSLSAAVRLGVAKVNYGTYLKQRYLTAMRDALAAASEVTNPHELLGIGGEHDLLVAGRLAAREAVLERIELLGCCGKA